MKSFGFFGGTFDPIHLGHLNLARHILEKKRLDHIFFSPANYSPEKEGDPPVASNEARKKMVELAIEEIPAFSVIDLELQREGPSYTIETIKLLMKEYPDAQFHLILGEDLLFGLPKWKEVEELLRLAPPLIGTRPGDGVPKLGGSIEKSVNAGKVEIPIVEISSTDLREWLLQKKDCRDFIPSKVLDYIEQKGLY